MLRKGACLCHSGHVYAGLAECPACHHKSFDPFVRSCERRRCGYEEARMPPASHQTAQDATEAVG